MKKVTSIFLFLMVALLISFSFPVEISAKEKDDSIYATTFRLEKIEGEVSITNAKGKDIRFKEGRKLYNGYTVSTEDGYAWVSIDKDRLFKIDTDSQIIVQQKNKKLNIMLKKGNLMFAVNKPLKEDEALSIRTSTMSTGIRGTLGIVSVGERDDYFKDTVYQDILNLIEGTVELSYYNEDTEEINTVTVNKGEIIAVNTIHREKEGVANVPVSWTNSNEMDVLDLLSKYPFALVEIRDNKDIYNRLTELENIDKDKLDNLLDNCDEILSENRHEQNLKREEAKKADLETKNKLDENKSLIDPFFKDNEEADNNFVPKPIENKKEDKLPTIVQEPEKFNVSFLNNGKVFAVYSVAKGETVNAPAKGATTNGKWVLDINKDVAYDFKTPVNSDLNLYWLPQVFNIYFYTNKTLTQDKLFAEQSVVDDQKIIEPKLMPSPEGYWSKDGQKYDFNYPVNSDLNLVWINTSK